MANQVKNFIKIVKSIINYKRQKVKVSNLPYFISIETSSICNLRCVMCPQSSDQDFVKRNMKLDLYKKIIDDVKGFATDVDLFSRGEPLLNPDIFEMIRYTKESGLKARIHSNGTLLTKEKGRKLVESGLDTISFSLDGYDKETYENIRVNANFEKTIENIKRLLEIKQSLNSEKPFVMIQNILVSTLDREQATEGINFFREYFKGLPVDEYKVIEQHTFAGLVEKEGEAGLHNNYVVCKFPWYAMFFLSDGTLVPCCNDWYAEYPLGNAEDIKCSDAFNGEAIQNLRKNLLTESGSKKVSICAKCDVPYRQTAFEISFKNIKNIKSFLRQHLFK